MSSQPLLAKLTADPAVNAAVRKALSGPTTNSLKQVVEAYNKLFKGIDAEWKTNLTVAAKEKKPAPVELPDADRAALRKVLYAEGTPINLLANVNLLPEASDPAERLQYQGRVADLMVKVVWVQNEM